MIKILIADDHPVVRKGLKEIIEEAPDMIVVGEASNGGGSFRVCKVAFYKEKFRRQEKEINLSSLWKKEKVKIIKMNLLKQKKRIKANQSLGARSRRISLRGK